MNDAKVTIMILAAVLLAACQTTGDNIVRIDNVPMYGQPGAERPAILKQADEDFIESAMSGLREKSPDITRRQASTLWFLTGENFMRKGDFDHAMRRYNQAWLLDPENYQSYWGFAQVMLETNRIEDAIEHFERALARVDDTKDKIALWVDAATAYAVRGEVRTKTGLPGAEHDFARANALYTESAKENPTNANIYRRWAMALYREGRYSDAWTKVAETRRRNGRPLPPPFLSDLSAKMPEPL